MLFLQTLIVMSNIAAGTDPKLFPDPYSFKPERWDRGNEQLPNSFSSLPFGYGRRSCVGKNRRSSPSNYALDCSGRRVAELEMHILLSQVVRNFKIEYRDGKPMEFDNAKLFYGPAREMHLAFIDVNCC